MNKKEYLRRLRLEKDSMLIRFWLWLENKTKKKNNLTRVFIERREEQ